MRLGKTAIAFEATCAQNIRPSHFSYYTARIVIDETFFFRLEAFKHFTMGVRRALCAVMVFAVVEKAGTVVMNDNEELDSWSVIINGEVQINTAAGINSLTCTQSACFSTKERAVYIAQRAGIVI